MIIKFYRILFGYLRVRFDGDFKERILSLCAQNGITLWATRLKNEKIESNISVREFKRLRIIARGKGIKAHIVKKRGLPFITNRYKRRYGILAGVIAFFLIIGLMSDYIWIIDVNGNNKISDKYILSVCDSIGIKSGIRKDSIYPKIEREKLMLKLEGIAWASLNIEGSRLTVNVTETKEKDKETEKFSNLKANADGVIKKIDIVSGTSVVNIGQAVMKGDLLVSGIIETVDGTRFVKSKGEIIALSQNEIVLKEDYKQKPLILTGEIKSKFVLEIFGLKIPFYLGSENGLYEATQKQTKMKIFGTTVPVSVYKKSFCFQREQPIKYNYDKLCQRLENKLENRLRNEDGAKVIKKEFSDDENGVTLKVLVEREENIAVSDILLINAGN